MRIGPFLNRVHLSVAPLFILLSVKFATSLSGCGQRRISWVALPQGKGWTQLCRGWCPPTDSARQPSHGLWEKGSVGRRARQYRPAQCAPTAGWLQPSEETMIRCICIQCLTRYTTLNLESIYLVFSMTLLQLVFDMGLNFWYELQFLVRYIHVFQILI